MRNFITTFSVIIAVIILSNSSCSKDDELDVSDPKNLIGTTWKYDDPESEYYSMIIFKSTIRIEVWEREPDEDPTLEAEGTYAISGGTITFIVDDETIIGSINSERITLNADGETLIFIKQ